MCERGVHHVFVTDLEGRPVRMITPTDILGSITLPATRRRRLAVSGCRDKFKIRRRRRAGGGADAMDDGRRFHDEM